MARKPKIDRSLLTQEEDREYNRRLQCLKAATGGENYGALPEVTQRRLATYRNWYWGIGLAAATVAAVVGASIEGVVTAVPFAMGACFMAGCIFGVAHLIQGGFAFERWAYGYLDEIGYHEREPKPKSGPTRTQVDTDGPHYWATGTYDPERYYRETRGWSPAYRDYVKDAYGDLDTYNANKPD